MVRYLIISLLSFALISTGYAYTPSDALESTLDLKIMGYEAMIQRTGESTRIKLLSILQEIIEIAPAKEYRNIEQEKFIFIISYLIDNIWSNGPKTLTRNDFWDTYNGFEIVKYPETIVATVRNTWPLGQTNDDSFQNLAGFIFGDNDSRSEIAMTSPVTRTQLDASSYETAFVMPTGWTMDTLPVPNNDRITIKTIPWSLKAVKRFGGRVSKDIVDQQRAEFQDDLKAKGIDRYGLPTLSQYDWPRVSAANRRNELWVELNER